jgi:hypothetical protein
MIRLVLRDLTPKYLTLSVNAPSSLLVWESPRMDNNGMNYNGVGTKWNGNQWKGINEQ